MDLFIQRQRIDPMQNWAWGLALTVLTIIVHVTGAAFMVLAQREIWNRLERCDRHLRHVFSRWVGMCAAIGLLLAVMHGIEIGIWAAFIGGSVRSIHSQMRCCIRSIP
jgi:hypothetical protein